MIAKASFLINLWIERLLCGMGLTMTLVVAVQVFFRYVMNHSLFWSEELARFLLVWLTFLGATSAYYRKVHPGVDFVFDKLSPVQKKTALVISSAASMVLFAVMIIYGIQFAWFVRMQIFPALQLPKWVVLAVIPVSGAVFMVHTVSFLLHLLKRAPHDH